MIPSDEENQNTRGAESVTDTVDVDVDANDWEGTDNVDFDFGAGEQEGGEE